MSRIVKEIIPRRKRTIAPTGKPKRRRDPAISEAISYARDFFSLEFVDSLVAIGISICERKGVPQFRQNLAVGEASEPHLGQTGKYVTCCVRGCIVCGTPGSAAASLDVPAQVDLALLYDVLGLLILFWSDPLLSR